MYFLELIGPLLRTLLYLATPVLMQTSPVVSPQVILSHNIRSLSKEAPFGLRSGFCSRPRPYSDGHARRITVVNGSALTVVETSRYSL